MGKHFRNLKEILIHKYHVFFECLYVGIPWRGLTHDNSKFLPSEFPAYSEHFYGDQRDERGFAEAFKLHCKRNGHHWQHWIANGKPIEIPDEYRKELLCDWIAASRRQGNNLDKWYRKKKNTMNLHPKTREWLADQISQL